MFKLTMDRTGLPPLIFDGELLANVFGSRVGTKEQTRWHDLRVCRTAAGQFIGHVEFRTNWDGETNDARAIVARDAGEIVRFFDEYDPVGTLVGYPAGAAYAEKQRRLEDDVRRRYRVGLTELYGALPAEWFAEEVA